MIAERQGPTVRQTIRALLGVVSHEIARNYQEMKFGWEVAHAPQGMIVRGEEIIANGKVVSLESEIKGVYFEGHVYIPNSYAGDKVVSITSEE